MSDPGGTGGASGAGSESIPGSLKAEAVSAPVWRTGPFIGCFGDAFLADTTLEGGQVLPSIEALATVLRGTVARCAEWLPRISGSREKRDAVERVAAYLDEAAEFGRLVVAARVRGGSAHQALLSALRRRLRELEDGGLFAVQGGWVDTGGGHAVFYVFERDGDTFAITVCNTGEGAAEYHPGDISDYPKEKRRIAMRLPGCDRARMLDEGFLFLLFSLQTTPREENNAAMLYEVLLPHALNRTILEAESAGDDSLNGDLGTLQRAGMCYYKCVVAAARYLLKRCGLSFAERKQVLFATRREYVRLANEDMLHTDTLDADDVRLLEVACHQVALAAIKEHKRGNLDTTGLEEVHEQLYDIRHLLDSAARRCMENDPPTTLSLASTVVPKTSFAGFHPFSEERSPEQFAGDETDAVAPRAVQFAPFTTCSTFADMTATFRTCVEQCDALRLETNVMESESVMHKVLALIEHVVSRVLPPPEPCSVGNMLAAPSAPWISSIGAIQVSEQRSLLSCIHKLFLHHVSATKSVAFDRITEAARLIVAAGLLAHFDFVVRLRATTDGAAGTEPSEWGESEHKKGEEGEASVSVEVPSAWRTAQAMAPLPLSQVLHSVVSDDPEESSSVETVVPNTFSKWFVLPLARDGRELETVTRHMLIEAPEIASLRSKVIRYFDVMRGSGKQVLNLKPDRSCPSRFRFAATDASLVFMQHLTSCIEMEDRLPDERGVDGATERTSTTTSDSERRARWLCYSWQYLPEIAQFRDMILGMSVMMESDVKQESISKRLWFSCDARSRLVWAGTSGSACILQLSSFRMPDVFSQMRQRDLSYLTSVKRFNGFDLDLEALGEDGVHHGGTLSTFDATLSVEDSQRLISFLAVPYTRIPLVLNFIADGREACLSSPTVRDLIEHVVFEPHRRPLGHADRSHQTVPLAEKLLGTECGLLYNELRFAPEATVNPLLKICERCADTCTGSRESDAADLLLWLLRILVAVLRFLDYLLDVFKEDREVKLRLRDRLAVFAHGRARRLLDRFIEECYAANDLLSAAKFHAHRASLFSFCTEEELHFDECCGFLASCSVVMSWNSNGEMSTPSAAAENSDETDDSAAGAGGMESATFGLGSLLGGLSRPTKRVAMRPKVEVGSTALVPVARVCEALQLQRHRLQKVLECCDADEVDTACSYVLGTAMNCRGFRVSGWTAVDHGARDALCRRTVESATDVAPNSKLFETIRFPGAASLTLQFSDDTDIDAHGDRFEVFKDASCTSRWIIPLSGRTDGDVGWPGAAGRPPATLPTDHVTIRFTASSRAYRRHFCLTVTAPPAVAGVDQLCSDESGHGWPRAWAQLALAANGNDVESAERYLLENAETLQERDDRSKSGTHEPSQQDGAYADPSGTMEVNLVTGEVFLRGRVAMRVPDDVTSSEDYRTVLGSSARLCALISRTANRRWMEIVDSPVAYDVVAWSPCDFSFKQTLAQSVEMAGETDENGAVPMPRYVEEYWGMPRVSSDGVQFSGLTYSVKYAAGALGWASEVIDHMLRHADGLATVQLWARAGVEDLFGVQRKTATAGGTQSVLVMCVSVRDYQSGNRREFRFLEVCVVFRTKLLEVFQIHEHCRRARRELVFSSDSRKSLHDMKIDTVDTADALPDVLRFAAGSFLGAATSTGVSVEVVRRCNEASALFARGAFVPRRFLHGAIPDALLDEYQFWQTSTSRLCGVRDSSTAGGDADVFIDVQLSSRSLNPDDEAAHGLSSPQHWQASVVRRSVTRSDVSHSLINFSDVEATSQFGRIASVLERVENLSYVLGWVETSESSLSVDHVATISLPRLCASFVLKPDGNGTVRLWSRDQAGLFVSDERPPPLLHLMRGLHQAIVLENLQHELFVMLPNFAVHRPLVKTQPFATQVVLSRPPEWLAACPQRFYIYSYHPSGTMLTAPSLAATLYLTVIRLINRDYEAASRLVAACATDMGFQSDETWAFNLTAATKSDKHPDAHAIRLLLGLVALSVGQECPYDLVDDFRAYLSKLPHVSAFCRLSSVEELTMLRHLSTTGTSELVRELQMRTHYLSVIGNDCERVTAVDTGRGLFREKVVFSTPPCSNGGAILSSLSGRLDDLVAKYQQWGRWSASLMFQRSAAVVTAPSAFQLVGEVFEDAWNGRRRHHGMLFLLDLLQGSTDIQLVSEDCSSTCSRTIAKIVSDAWFVRKSIETTIDFHKPGLVGLVLLHAFSRAALGPAAIAERVRALLPALPTDSDDPRKPGWKMLLAGKGATFSKQLRAAALEICKDPDFLESVTGVAAPPPSMTSIVLSSVERHPQRLHVSDYNCSRRLLSVERLRSKSTSLHSAVCTGITSEELHCFATNPLTACSISNFLRIIREAPETLTSDRLPFEIDHHPDVRSRAGRRLLERLRTDLQAGAASCSTRTTTALRHLTPTCFALMRSRGIQRERAVDDAISALQELQRVLVAQAKQDTRAVAQSIPRIEEAANHVSLQLSDTERDSRIVFRLNRLARRRTPAWFGYLTRSLLSSRAEEDIVRVNPFLQHDDCSRVLDNVAVTLLRIVRVSHLQRCMSSVDALRFDLLSVKAATDAAADTTLAALERQCEGLVRMLQSRRHYMVPVDAVPGSLEYDPRFLVFEYSFTYMLRRRQVELVRQFHSAAVSGNSQVAQMIMGAGKTTVIAPLLTLLLADGRSLVTLVVPDALLAQTVAVMRAQYSAIFQKRVYTLDFDRTEQREEELDRLLTKLIAARDTKSVICATPEAIKSLMLKFIEFVQVGDERCEMLRRVLQLWSAEERGVLILDEVDVVLHPLRSELNFPIGDSTDIDFLPSRWRLPIWLFDALYFGTTLRVSVDISPVLDPAVQVLDRIRAAVDDGASQGCLVVSPQVVLLQPAFYHAVLLPLLADWMVLFLRTNAAVASDFERIASTGSDSTAGITSFISGAVPIGSTAAESLATSCTPGTRKYLNLARHWLTELAPHCLQKVNRVSFGLLTDVDCARLGDGAAQVSRRLLAVPFVGKDVPSPRAEFAHPDIRIGLTILAARQQGVNRSLVHDTVAGLKRDLQMEHGPMWERPSYLRFEKWLRDGWMHVAAPAEVSAAGGPHGFALGALNAVLPEDANQLNELCRALARTPEFIHEVLDQRVFPTTMHAQPEKLAASGMDLGGDMLFGARIGFSGTPSDLLPREFNGCRTEPGSDAKILLALTNSGRHLVTCLELAEWDVELILRAVATSEPPFHALVDTGALITGFTNETTAEMLLRFGLEHVEGCVFLNDANEKVVKLRGLSGVVALSECGLPPNKRFTFYDHVHTTGTDIRQCIDARAAVTLGKDMTFRDYAQGCWRMRGLENGQTLTTIVTKEVLQLVHQVSETGNLAVDIVAWLLVSSARADELQHMQLLKQSLAHVWRRNAMRHLVNEGAHSEARSVSASTDASGEDESKGVEDAALDTTADSRAAYFRGVARSAAIFRERLDHDISDNFSPQLSFNDQLRRSAEAHSDFTGAPDDRKRVSVILAEATTVAAATQGAALDADMVRLAENEEQAEEQRQQQQESHEVSSRACGSVTQIKWSVANLLHPGRLVESNQFVRLRDYVVASGVTPLTPLLPSLYLTSNYAGAPSTELKNVHVLLVWSSLEVGASQCAILCLAEAASLRRHIHAAPEMFVGLNIQLLLADGTSLERLGKMCCSSEEDARMFITTSRAVARFFDCQMWYSPQETVALLDALVDIRVDDRLAYFRALQSRRTRERQVWDDTSVSVIFSQADSSALRELTNTGRALYSALEELSLTPREAFAAIDREGKRRLTLPQAYDRLMTLIDTSSERVRISGLSRLLRAIDADARCCVTEEEFVRYLYRAYPAAIDRSDVGEGASAVMEAKAFVSSEIATLRAMEDATASSNAGHLSLAGTNMAGLDSLLHRAASVDLGETATEEVTLASTINVEAFADVGELQEVAEGFAVIHNDGRVSTRGRDMPSIAPRGLMLASGRHYYELHVVVAGPVSAGFASTAYTGSSAARRGVGDDENSWGLRAVEDELWAAGDAVGCCVDVDDGMIRIFVNDTQVAYQRIPPSSPVVPVVSFCAPFEGVINLGVSAFVRDVPDGFSGAVVVARQIREMIMIRQVGPSAGHWIPMQESSQLRIDGYCLEAVKVHKFPSAILGGVLLTHGRWWYELCIMRAEHAQVGWADTDFVGAGGERFGCGDDRHSWGWGLHDGHFGPKGLVAWHAGLPVAFPVGGSTKWKSGDVVGCAIDIDCGDVWWGLNGEWQQFGEHAVGRGGFSPCVSLYGSARRNGVGIKVASNFGGSGFSFGPPAPGFRPVHEWMSEHGIEALDG